jgi:hypothetical protein
MSRTKPRIALAAAALVSGAGIAGAAAGGSVATAVTAAGPVNGGGAFVSAPGAHPVPPRRGPLRPRFATATVGSSNWSGYVQSDADGTYTAVEDTWTVPTVSPSGRKFSSDWVGIGGFSDSTLVQAGTEADSLSRHKTLYQAWTEVLPQAEDPLSLSIAPGNHITVLVEETLPDTWLMQVSDLTTGQTQSRTVSYVSSGASVEVIHERPCLREPCSKHLAKLTTTTPVSFDPGSFSTTPAGGTPVFNPILVPTTGGQLADIVMFKNARTVYSTPSASDSDNDGFTVQNGAAAPAPPNS